MLRAAWLVCVVLFAALACACAGGGSSSTSGPAPEPEKPGERVEGFKKAATVGGMEVVIRGAFIDRVAMELIDGGRGFSEAKYLTLVVAVRAADATKRYDYTTWTGTDRHVKDDLGNTYPHIIIAGGRPVGRTVHAPVRSDAAVTDVLIIDRPVAAAKYLDIDLPAPFDKSKVFRFRIQTADITRP
jgi:hypothetical protein